MKTNLKTIKMNNFVPDGGLVSLERDGDFFAAAAIVTRFLKTSIKDEVK